MTATSDIEGMIGRVAMGDRQAFAALYAATSGQLFGICLQVLQDPAQAELALQEIYACIWQDAGRYQVETQGDGRGDGPHDGPDGGHGPMAWLVGRARDHATLRLHATQAMTGPAGAVHPAGVPDLPGAAPDVAPPRGVLSAIEARLFPVEKSGFWRRFGLWIALLGGAAALMLVLFVRDLVYRTTPEGQVTPIYVAELVATDEGLRLLATYDPESGRLHIERASGAARAGRVLELWLVAGDNPPMSLGVLPAAEATDFTLTPDLLGGFADGALGVSDEAPGGSPSGAPTGGLLAVADIAAI